MKAIDLFAGSGGFSTGARLAGVDVIWAANHSPLAVQCHAQNHPHADHVCQDLHQADWSKVPSCDILLGSPCCQGHSKARGKDTPQHDASRSTAWAVTSCCEYHRPAAFIVENVPEFLGWSLYPAWRLAMELLGYKLTTTVLDSADAGVPQNRERLFVVGSLRGPVALTKPTAQHVPISAVLDWTAGNWSPIRKAGRAAATLHRAANGRAEFGRRFVMPYYGNGSGLTGRSIARPVGTITTRDRWAVVDDDRMRMFTIQEYRAGMSFPADYVLPSTRKEAIELLGNAVPPLLAEHVIRQVATTGV